MGSNYTKYFKNCNNYGNSCGGIMKNGILKRPVNGLSKFKSLSISKVDFRMSSSKIISNWFNLILLKEFTADFDLIFQCLT